MNYRPVKSVLCLVALLYASCVPPKPGIGAAQVKSNSPIISISAGIFQNPGAIHVGQAFYLIDTSSRNCMILVTIRSPPVVTPITCCSLMNVPAAKPYLTWLDSASCSK